MGGLLVVEVEDFVAAARRTSVDVGDPLCLAQSHLAEVLSGCGGMAGSDPGGRQWAAAYDPAARAALVAGNQLVQGAYALASLFGRAGLNYAEADAASTTGGAATTPLVQALPAETSVGPARTVPSAAGPGGGGPPGWFLVQAVVGRVWPNGHQDRLRRAADAWRTSANRLSEATCAIGVVGGLFVRDRLPEQAEVDRVLADYRRRLGDAAHVHARLGEACEHLADALDHCHREVEGALTELMGETALIEGFGLLASFFTLGAAEAPTQAIEAGRVAAAANRIREVVDGVLRTVAGLADTLPGLAAMADEVTTALNALAHSHGIASAAIAVPGLIRCERGLVVGTRASRLTRAEIAEIERLSGGRRIVADLPPALKGRKLGDPGHWYSPKSLRKHFDKRGAKLGAATPDEMSTMATDLLQRGLAGDLPVRVTRDGTAIRVYDPAADLFGSFAPDGRTFTIFKPDDGVEYFLRQEAGGHYP